MQRTTFVHSAVMQNAGYAKPPAATCNSHCSSLAFPAASGYRCSCHFWHDLADGNQGARASDYHKSACATCPRHNAHANNSWRAPPQAPRLCMRSQLALFCNWPSVQTD